MAPRAVGRQLVEPPKLVILGAPGSGKGTHARTLARRLAIPHVSTGALLRNEIEAGTPLGRRVSGVVRSGGLVADEDVVRIVRQALDAAPDGWILDGAPRTLRQAELLAPAIEAEHPAVVLALEVDDDEVRRRLTRRRSDEQRADDDPAVVEHRIATWLDTWPHLEDRYGRLGLLIRVDGMGTIAATSSRVWDAVQSALAGRAGGASAERGAT